MSVAKNGVAKKYEKNRDKNTNERFSKNASQKNMRKMILKKWQN